VDRTVAGQSIELMPVRDFDVFHAATLHEAAWPNKGKVWGQLAPEKAAG